ncbi:phosphoribosylformylglycinamidine cyclo-ligase [Longibacter salinarum]|uniref:Phosphoribosylformylglycinamidine cyclo-ligase n=1 Tax=Longibacter salinarum TaxID=1850348 RepID=A0A2A8D2D2_9BACT|nr:phosphoribosylformylglycinamidine cyclo-ligase [Longibacter salinarum]PEN15041.1 phosphoribosylformylglycinamidine cyclo-ligase [Longibacter salinarum]
MTTYKESGVDVDAGDDAVDRIKPIVQETFTPGVLAGIGSFGSYVELDADAYDQPVLVSSIDGVGTKVKVAVRAGRFDTVGQDLVNHCVNDVAVCGARPLYFLDYYGVGRLDPATAEDVVRGFSTACKQTGTALVGGEIAEMPDVYGGENFDLVGCIVAVVEKRQILNGSTTEAGDVLVGLPSTGLHTNGYTLARKVLFDAFDVDDTPAELDGESVGEALLRVHRSYLGAIQAIVEAQHSVRGFAHITGGGLPGNLRRIMPDGCQAVVDYDAWDRPPLFELIQSRGNVPESDMRRTFNCGIGLVGVFPESEVDAALETLKGEGEHPVVMGKVESVASRT